MDIDKLNRINEKQLSELDKRIAWEKYKSAAKFCIANNYFPQAHMKELNIIKDIVRKYTEQSKK